MHTKTILEIRALLQKKEISVTEVVRDCLVQIKKTEPSLNAIISLQADEALEQAKKCDATGFDHTKSLWGIPIFIKDLISTKGIATTCASEMLKDYVPPYDAFLVEKLKNAGAIILGKNNLDEFAMGSTTETSIFGSSKNPWNIEHTPGGSSGGSAASVASLQAYASIGTDTGGSVRQPASFCGVVGLKPTYGRVSRYGMVAFASSLDQAGPITRTVEDAALVLGVIAGHDSHDSTCVNCPVPDYLLELKDSNLKGKIIGLPKEYWGEGLSDEVLNSCQNAIKELTKLGAIIKPISLPHMSYAVATYYILATAEASSNLGRYDGIRYGYSDENAKELVELYTNNRSHGFGEEVQRRIMLGTFVLSSGYYDAYFQKAAKIRRLIRNDFDEAFKECDIVCSPVSPTVAFPLGENSLDPLKRYLADIFTISANLAGIPALSLPVGLGDKSSLPIGLQFFAPAFAEKKLLQAAWQLEQVIPKLPTPFGIK